MLLTPTLWFEIGAAVLIAVTILWTKVEYGLFLYGFALGFPDCALPLAGTVNLRLDDALLVVLLARMLLWRPAPLTRSQRSIFLWQGAFLAVCAFSLAVETVKGSPPLAYDAAKMAGCAAIFFFLPRILQSQTRLRFFVIGLMSAGVALVVQVRQHLDANGPVAANFQQLKSAAGFDTWNPNTIGQAAILLVLAAGLGWITFSEVPATKVFWLGFAAVFALLPASVFVRGSFLSIVAGLILFLGLLRRWKSLLVFAAVGLLAMAALYKLDGRFLEGAAAVNATTGEGLSGRFNRWGMAMQAIHGRPFAGQGFGQELCYLTLIGGQGVAHDDYLTVWLELGLGGLVLFLAAIFQFVRAGRLLFTQLRFQRPGALILAATAALFLDSLGLPTLYWEKLPTIALGVATALVGLCEDEAFEVSVDELGPLAGRRSEQLSSASP